MRFSISCVIISLFHVSNDDGNVNTQRDTSDNLIRDTFKDFSERHTDDSRLVDTDLWDPTMVKIIGDEL